MTTDELIAFLRNYADFELSAGRVVSSDCLLEAAEKMKEQEKIIKQYQKADCFLAAHGWEWEEGGSWYDD